MNRIFNPFVIGKYAGSEYFCDRIAESELLCHNIINGRNVTLMSDRRLGKTGLIEHTFATKLPNDGYYTFLIDIYTARNLREFTYLLANEMFKVFSRKQSLLTKLLTFLKSLNLSVTYSAVTGEPEVSFKLGQLNNPEITLDELFLYLSQADKPCVVAIDEFQQIAYFEEKNMEELLRTKIQHLQNTIFVFAGSEKHLMEEIFNDPERPFYNSVVFQQLLPIDKDVYVDFSKRLFSSFNKDVDAELVKKLYEYFKGVTWYLQLSMNEAFAITAPGERLEANAFPVVIQYMINTKRFTFEDRYRGLTEKQKTVLKALAEEYPNAPAPTSREFIEKYHLKTASSVQTAIKGLVDKKIMREYRGERQISDILFVLWLKEN